MPIETRLAKLTEREKVCLRQWLERRTAKEIARNLGISHHAVEKRLKMARLKLDASSSLEAARMLSVAEGYGPAVPGSPDLQNAGRFSHSISSVILVSGVIMMSLIAAGVLVFMTQASIGETYDPAPVEAKPSELVINEHDEQLDIALMALVASAQIGSDGEVFLSFSPSDPRYLEPQSGYYWQISGDGHADFASRSLWDRRLVVGDMVEGNEAIRYTSTPFANQQIRIAEKRLVLPGSNVQWRFIVTRPVG